MAINQEARIPVYLNDEQAKQALKNLTSEAEKWRKKMHQAMAAGDPKGVKQAEREMKKATAAANKLKRETFDVDRVLQNLSRASVADLRKAMNRLRSEQRLLNRDTKEYKAISRQIGQIKGEFSKINGAVTQQRSILDRLKGAAGGLLPAFGVAAIITGIGRLGKSLFNLTSQIQGETIRSVTVFGDQLGYVEQQAEKVAAKMGVTNREFVSMAANTADLLIPLDFTREQAAKMSTEVQGLAGALDEWTAGQIGVTEVSNILTKAMLGENEQLKRLGIAIRKDTEEYRVLVKQKLETENVTRAQAEAMATLELLYKKSADAQAAYEREGNKLLRTQKSVTLWWKNMKEGVVAYFDEDVAKKLMREKSEVNALAVELTSANTAEDRRREILQQLQTINPKIVEGLSAENIEVEKLKNNLKLYNEELANRIVLQNLTEDEEKEAAKVAKQMEMVARYQVEINRMIAETDENIALSTDSFEEKIRKTVEVLKNQPKKRDIYGNWIDGSLELRGLVEQLELSQLRLNKAQAGQTDLSERVQAMKEILGLTQETDTGDGGETATASSLLTVQQKLLEQAKQWPETTEAEIAAKNRRIQTIETEIARLRELGIAKKEAETPDTGAPGMVQAEDVQMKQANIRAEEIDALKAMEADWLAYQKQMDEKGQELSENNIARWEEEAEGYKELTLARIWAAGQMVDALVDMAGRETKLGKALFLFNRALAISEIVIETARANAKAVRNSPMTAGLPWVAINTAVAAGNIAAVIGQTVAAFSGPGKKSGGWTGNGSDNQVADFVHANEFVVNAKAARNPTIRPLLDLINQAQIAGTVAQLDFSKMISSGKQSGGYTTNAERSVSPPAQGESGFSREGVSGSEALLTKLDAIADRIEKIKIYAAIETIERERKNYMEIQQQSGL